MMLRPNTLLCTGMVFIAMGAGCSNMTMLRTRELRQVQYHVDSLRTHCEDALSKYVDLGRRLGSPVSKSQRLGGGGPLWPGARFVD